MMSSRVYPEEEGEKEEETTTTTELLSDYFGHYVVASKKKNSGRNPTTKGRVSSSSTKTSSQKNLLGRKEIFAAHKEDKAKDVFICEGEQTRNRGSYTFYSSKNLLKAFASVGGTLRAATRDELKAWLEKMNLEGAVVENDKDETRAVYMHENGGEDHKRLENARVVNPRAKTGIPPQEIASNLAYSSAVHTVKESHERKMTEKRLKQRQEEEREAEEDAERQIGHKMRKKPKTEPKFVSIKYPSPTTKKLRRGSKDAENEDFFGHREDPFLRTIAGDESDDDGDDDNNDGDDENNDTNNNDNNNSIKVVQFKTGEAGGDLRHTSDVDNGGGAFDEKFSYDSDIMNSLANFDEQELNDLDCGELSLSHRRFSSYEEINAPSIASKKDMEENPFHKRSGFYLRSRVLNERGIFAIIKERKENSNGHYNYNVSDELRGLCEPSWNPPSFKNAADAKAWLDEVLKKTPLTKKERKDLEEASEQDVNARMAPDPVMKTYKNGDEKNIRKTMSRNDTNAATTTTNRTHAGKKNGKICGGVAENQRQNLQASFTWTMQRADASTVEALRDIARGIVTRLSSNTLPPERAVSALDALKDVDMSLELLELSPIASAVSAIAEDDCSMTNEARQTAKELLQSWKEAAQRGVKAIESRIQASEQYLMRSGIKRSSE